MQRNLILLVFIFFINWFWCSFLWAYDGVVHYRISDNASTASQLDLVLEKQIGFVDGIESNIKRIDSEGNEKIQKIWQWIAFGGEAEDYGKKGKNDHLTTRAYNHFHDPLENWEDAGFDSWINFKYREHYGQNPVSSILWGMDTGQQEVAEETTGDWSWSKAKESYYIFLTGKNFEDELIADREKEKKSNFADCFRNSILYTLAKTCMDCRR